MSQCPIAGDANGCVICLSVDETDKAARSEERRRG